MGDWYNVGGMEAGVETRLTDASDPSVPPHSRRLERRLHGTRRVRRAPLAALVAVAALALGGLVWWVASPSSPTAAPAAHSSVAATRAVQGATDLVTSAGSNMSLGMAGLKTLPTVASVSAVVDPYLTALQRYQASLSGAVLAGSAATWRRAVLSQVQQLVGLLQSLGTTPSGQLGTWISGFYLQTAELQNSVEGLQSALSAG